LTVNRTWSDSDRVDLQLPMPLFSIPGVNNSISIARGPLVFSLKLPEQKKIVKPGPDGFVQLELTSPDPWNFALNVDPAHLESAVQVQTAPLPTGSPFQPDASPVSLNVPGKLVPSWRTNWTGRIADDPPLSPVSSDQPQQTVTLVPFGSQTLRITAFPWLGQPTPPPAKYRCDFANTDLPGWVLYGGSWHVENGQFYAPRAAGTAGVKAVAIATDFTDLTFDAEVTPSTAGDTGLIFRVTRPSMGDNAFNGYYTGITPSNQEIVLGKCNADENSWTPIAHANIPVATGAAIHFHIVAEGTSIRVFINNASAPAITASDNTFTHGAIGVRRYATTETTPAAFTNLSVSSTTPG
jgi:hypothetical protein